jgi:hypothetical protein
MNADNLMILGCTPWVRHGGKDAVPFNAISFCRLCPVLNLRVPVKQRRALLASNPIEE